MKVPFINHLSWLSYFGFEKTNDPATLRPLANPFDAIVWSFWIGGAKTLAYSLLFTPFVYLACRVVFSSDSTIKLTSVWISIQILSFFQIFLHSDVADDLATGLPKRMFVLPIATRTLVFYMIAIGLVSSALFSATIDLVFLHPIGYGVPVIPLMLASAAALSWVQAFSWTPIEPAWAKPYLALIGLIALVGIACWTIQIVHASSTIVSLLFASYLIGAFLVMLKGVERARRGDFFRFGKTQSIHQQPGAIVFRRFHPFRSPAAALFRLEWSFNLWIVAVLSMILTILTGASFYFLSGSNESIRPTFLNTSMIIIPIFSSFFYAYESPRFKPIWSGFKDRFEFFAVMPIKTNDFIKTKFLVALSATFSSWAGFLIAAGFDLAYDIMSPKIDNTLIYYNTNWLMPILFIHISSLRGFLLVVSLIGFSWNGATFMLAAELDRNETKMSKSMSIFIASIVTIFPIVLSIGLTTDWIIHVVILLLYLSPILAIWKIARSFVAFRKALAVELIGEGTVALGVCVWIGLSACSLMTIGLLFAEFSSIQFWIVSVSLVATITPLAAVNAAATRRPCAIA